jgi:hypothetical protein
MVKIFSVFILKPLFDKINSRKKNLIKKTGGSSNNPCSDTYAGPSADSELETQAIEQAIRKYQGRWDAFFTIHAYGLWWFTNYGFTPSLPLNYDESVQRAQKGVDAIKAVNGLEFELGSSARILYINSGASEDWAFGVAGVPWTYCLELRPGQTVEDSIYGFAIYLKTGYLWRVRRRMLALQLFYAH